MSPRDKNTLSLEAWAGKVGILMRGARAGVWATGVLTMVMLGGVVGVQDSYAVDDSITVTIDDPTLDVNIAPKNANGTFSKSNNSTISVKTTNATGYTLSVRANSSTDYDKLINGSYTLSSVGEATTEEQFKALAGTGYNGMWGYLPSKLNSITNTDFLPAPNTNGDVINVTECANGTTNCPDTVDTYTMAIGARVDISQTLGSYSNVYLVSATANSVAYSIVYNDDVVTNMPTDVNAGEAVGGTFNIASNIPVRSGYAFLGWCTKSGATSQAACTAAGGTFYTASQAVSISATTAFELYAVWAVPTPEMQNWTGCSSMSVGDTVTMVDNRDNEEYLIGKLADNKCWMLDNLRLNPATATLNTSNTHMNASVTPTYTNTTSSFSSYTAAQFNANYKDNTTTSYGSGSGKVGVYYNYCAASAGTICTSSNSSNASYDICPAGWRMPTGGSSGEYQALYAAYSSNATDFRTALSTPLSGYFYNSSQGDLGSYGRFWSSTRIDYDDMHYLRVSASNVDPANNGFRDRGVSMRCVAQ